MDNHHSLQFVMSMAKRYVVKIAAGSFHSILLTEDVAEHHRDIWVSGQDISFNEQNFLGFEKVEPLHN